MRPLLVLVLFTAAAAGLAAPPTPPLADPHAAALAAAASADVAALPHSDCFSSVLASLKDETDATPCAHLTHGRQVQVALAFLACHADFLGEKDLPACARKALADDGGGSYSQAGLQACVSSLPGRHYETFQGFFRGAASTCLHYAHRDWQAHAGALLARAVRASAEVATSLEGVRVGVDLARAQLSGLQDEAVATRRAAEAGRKAASQAADVAGGVAEGLEAVRERTLAVAAVASEAAVSARLAADRNERAAAAVDELAAAERRRAVAAAQAHEEREAAAAKAADAAQAREAELAASQEKLASRLDQIDARTAGLASTVGAIYNYQAGVQALLRRVLGMRGAGATRAFYGAVVLASAAAAAVPRTRAAVLPLVAGAAWLLAAERGAAAALPWFTVATALGGARGAWWAPGVKAAEHLVSCLAAGGARPPASLAALTLTAWAASAWVDPVKAARAALEAELAELRAARGVLVHARPPPPPRQPAAVPPATPARVLRPRPTRRSGG